RLVGRKTIAGNKLYEPSAASKVAGGSSGMRSFIFPSNLTRFLRERKLRRVRVGNHFAPLRDCSGSTVGQSISRKDAKSAKTFLNRKTSCSSNRLDRRRRSPG